MNNLRYALNLVKLQKKEKEILNHQIHYQNLQLLKNHQLNKLMIKINKKYNDNKYGRKNK